MAASPPVLAAGRRAISPDKIILFGSHAYGTPHADSDVDILVIMPTRNQFDQAARIGLAIDPPFPLDIRVRTPHTIGWRLAEGVAYGGASAVSRTPSLFTALTWRARSSSLAERNAALVSASRRKRGTGTFL